MIVLSLQYIWSVTTWRTFQTNPIIMSFHSNAHFPSLKTYISMETAKAASNLCCMWTNHDPRYSNINTLHNCRLSKYKYRYSVNKYRDLEWKKRYSMLTTIGSRKKNNQRFNMPLSKDRYLIIFIPNIWRNRVI